ncbi:hypothetical protein AGR4C_pa50028 [Agrobacterium tumefaciens str. Kerr 14]|uniref:Uncharacterized protein n=1 Tax=Agrobacterium tumefaciens str. Kerr 14 TaxID=1183424 RepID=A0A1S7SAS6_AGRTU|nr:hypothetical protein AGR4C_pa50028 [Agrobacterium tumefaciens str. Kerr 14]
MFFWAGGNLKRFFENFGFHRVLAMQALQFLNLVLSARYSDANTRSPKWRETKLCFEHAQFPTVTEVRQ